MTTQAQKSTGAIHPRDQWDDRLRQVFRPIKDLLPRIGRPGSWFLGPSAENRWILATLVIKTLHMHCEHRNAYAEIHSDPDVIDYEVRQGTDYQDGIRVLGEELDFLNRALQLSAPIASMRSHGHMLWDQVLPAMVGYFAGMLYNQNNVAPEASPVTTWMEIKVCEQLCEMLGYSTTPTNPPQSWGHITCDGSVANIEALWAARNAKFYAVALRAAIRAALKPDENGNFGLLKDAKDLEVNLPDGTQAKLLELDRWKLVNLTIDEVLDLPGRIKKLTGEKITEERLSEELEPFEMSQIGLVGFYDRYLLNYDDDGTKPVERDDEGGTKLAVPGDADRSAPISWPSVMVPATAHYSWPKGGTLLGLGKKEMVPIEIDDQFRMRLGHLEDRLEWHRRYRIPVLAVVAVLGTTEEGAVDPLKKILALRDKLRKAHNFDFAIHCDAAWGGYFQCMLQEPRLAPEKKKEEENRVPVYPMNDYVREQYEVLNQADSITVDPHKSGFTPYPAGAICYRNYKLRDKVALIAPVVLQDKNQPSVGVYGIEGSKPGAAAASVFLAHRVIPLDRTGYGWFLGQCTFTSKRVYCRLRTMNDRDRGPIQGRYKIVMLQPLPAERDSEPWGDLDGQLKTINEFVGLNNNQLLKELSGSKDKTRFFNELGSDQLILAFAFNFREKGALDWNEDPGKFNKFNKEIFKRCSVVEPPKSNKIEDLPPLILTGSQFDPKVTGTDFIKKLLARLRLKANGEEPSLRFLISTTMNPWTTVVPDSPRTPNGDFLQVIEDTLRSEVAEVIKALDRG